MPGRTVYKILTHAEWQAAQAAGVYRGSAHDLRDGFIHFSTAAQLGETARKYFRGVPDLVLLAVDVERLKEPLTPHPVPLPKGEGQDEVRALLRWEPSRGGDLFPHLYGDLSITAVRRVTAITLGEDGALIIPADLPS